MMIDTILMKTIPGEYRIESTVNLESTLLNILSAVPVINKITASHLKKTGKVFLRVMKVDVQLPDEYRINGWKIRNKSERADGTYYSGHGYVSLGNQGRGEDLPSQG
jgi:hypothetical protein